MMDANEVALQAYENRIENEENRVDRLTAIIHERLSEQLQDLRDEFNRFVIENDFEYTFEDFLGEV